MEDCPHNKVNADHFCLACYAQVPTAALEAYVPVGAGMLVRRDYARRQSETVTSAVIRKERLVLVLDLDGTIVFTALGQCVDSATTMPPTSGFVLTIDGGTHAVLFRPGLREFMLRVSPLFEIHVATMGRKAYAAAIVERINALAERPFITGDVLTFEDCANEHVASTLEHDSGELIDPEAGVLTRFKKGFSPMMGGEEVQVIVDDRVDVWDSQSVLQVVEWVGDKADTELVRVAGVLEDIHRRFYASRERNVQLVLKGLRGAVLAGVRLFFKRPKTLYINPLDFERWWATVKRNAEAMGAIIQQEVHETGADKTTYIIDAQPWDATPGVSIRWVEVCWIMLERVPTDPFLITKDDVNFYATTVDDVAEARKRTYREVSSESSESDESEHKRKFELLSKLFAD